MNISRCGQFNLLHDHGSYTWSAVYYVAPGNIPTDGGPHEGHILFRTAVVAGLCQYTSRPPVPGTLLVFPGWLPHCVCPVTSAQEEGSEDLPRISIAFNFNFGTREVYERENSGSAGSFDVRPPLRPAGVPRDQVIATTLGEPLKFSALAIDSDGDDA